MMNERLKASNLTPAHHSHKQYPEIKSDSDKLKTHPDQETHPGADRDSHHAPASPEEYIIWRLSPLRAFYGRRIPQVRRTRLLMQIFFMASTSATAVLAAADQTAWTPIVVAISAALASWQEFRGVDMKLERYGAVVATLRNLMLWWQTLPEADKADALRRVICEWCPSFSPPVFFASPCCLSLESGSLPLLFCSDRYHLNAFFWKLTLVVLLERSLPYEMSSSKRQCTSSFFPVRRSDSLPSP